MSRTQAINVPQLLRDPKTRTLASWSRDETFQLLEKLLEARRNRTLCSKDRTASRVYESIAETFRRSHPSNPPIWTSKRLRNKFDDLAHLYKYWYMACDEPGCHGDRKTGKIIFDTPEARTLVISKHGSVMQRVTKRGLLCRDTFHMDHYDEVFGDVPPPDRPTNETQNVNGISPERAGGIADESQAEEYFRDVSRSPPGPWESTEPYSAASSDLDDEFEDSVAAVFARIHNPNPVAASSALSSRIPAQASDESRGQSKRAASSVNFDEIIGLLTSIRNKRPRHETPNPEIPKMELAVRDALKFAEKYCVGPGMSIVQWLARDPTSNPVIWLAMDTDVLKQAWIKKLGIYTGD
ncbi:hypothetical protein E4U31_003628 [Claviceps sp. LM219 group G6]|nr:hypothetical protein E4U15_004230 [Claviceps sp. LM218 group G6]KAG6101581.1 hypothetical protein E4U31_003628 [Claviceps sp. LM219 group G6]